MRLLYTALIIAILGGIFIFQPQDTEAATLTAASDTITTSRPSASSPLNAVLNSTDTQATIFNNGSRYLASDSAQIIKTATGAIVDAGTIVSSQSGSLTTVFFGEQADSDALPAADVLFVPITALHTIQFTTASEIPANGRVIITFPGGADNSASPSATTFAFNGLNSGSGLPAQIVTDNITCNGSSTVAAPIITCITDSIIIQGTTLTFLIGCTAQSGGACTTQAPRLINPTKPSTVGTADIWKINIATDDGSGGPLDDATVAIATIETVHVLATVDPSLTFTIGWIANGGSNIVTQYPTCTGNTDVTNTGINATVTVVNMGVVSSLINIAAQELTVATNAPSGYVLSATSSAPLRDFSSGHSFLTDASLPGSQLTAGNEFFGIHPCGEDVNATNWGTGATGGGVGARYAWPNDGTLNTTLTLASRSGVANSIVTIVEYAVTASAITPAGLYQAFVTYIATPTF